MKCFLQCSLWGNKADLSLSGGKAVAAKEDIYSEMNTMNKSILVNDLDQVYELLNTGKDNIVGVYEYETIFPLFQTSRMCTEMVYFSDIVLDNAGYELFNDLCFADYLVQAGFAKKIIFHGKAIPWFVSDVTPVDFTAIFEVLLNQIKSDHVVTLVHAWSKYLENGIFESK